MKTIELTLARIGNSRGIRLPAALIRKHGLEPGMVFEDRGHELVLRPKGGARKLSWEETARQMVADSELSKSESAALRELLSEMYGAP